MKKIIILVGILALYTSCSHRAAREESKNPAVTEKVEISIRGMSCTGCEETITRSALALEGVKEATASYKEGKAWITYEQGIVSTKEISASIEKTGYQVTGITTVEKSSPLSQ